MVKEGEGLLLVDIEKGSSTCWASLWYVGRVSCWQTELVVEEEEGSTAGVSYLILQTKTAVEGGNEKELGKEVTVVDGLASQTQAI